MLFSSVFAHALFFFLPLFVPVPAKIHLPKNLEGMGAVHALRGEVVSIKIPFSGKPPPVITWQKGQDLIDTNGHYQVIVTRSFTSLVFPNGVDRKDAGFYIVCAKNRFGIDQKTVELDVADVPDPPRGLKVTDISRDSVNLTWIEPATDGGSRIINYIIEKRATTAERWIRVAQARDTRYTVVNLFGKTTYQFRVIAENKFGQSQPSEPTDPIITKEDKTRVMNYDEEVDETREVTIAKAAHYSTKELYDKYMIAEELGRGQFGITHRCVEAVSKKTYLAKFVKVKGADQVLVKKEISILNIARHRNILYLHESFESLEELVMIFEFISGVDIFERISTASFELNEREIVSYVRQVCDALEFLHRHSIGHFDIKPDSIIYFTRRSSVVKIVEFGQARQLKPGDSFRLQFTSPEYYAPEVHHHDLVSTATDMWSVGALTYILLSGINPFIAETNQQVIENILNAEYNFDDEAFKDISIEAMDFVDRLLVKERKARMTAAEALNHTWLKQKTEKTSTKTIKTLRHRRYYHTLVKKEWNTVVSVARISCGGAIRSQKGVTVAKVKVAPIDIGPITGQINHAAAEEGGHAKYVCKIENYDQSTQVTWYFGMRQLENSEKYEISYEEGVATMYVKDVSKSDDGTYRCKVINDYGEDSSYAELFVKGVREMSEHYRRRAVRKVKRRVDAMRLLERPPEFTLPLYNRTAYVGENVRFGVTITVHPEPRLTWFKSGQRIKPGDDDKYTFESDKGLYQLIINKVTEEDDAEYSIVARNKYGEDSCKAKLTVIPHPPPADTTLRPMFKRLLANNECQEGQNVSFEIRVSGIPKPTLTWEKDGQPLSFGPNFDIVHEGLDYYALHIRDTLPEDSGYYRVTATNSAGSTSCQAYLKVERLKYVKREYKTEEEREKHVQRQIDKTLRMAEILSGTEAVPLTQTAQEALREAAILYKPAVSTKTVKGEYEIKKEEKKEERKLRMPYEVPEPRKHVRTTLEEDQTIKHFVPLSDMKWYKRLRDQYEMPGKLERTVQKRQKRIRLSRWEQFYVMPLPRISDQYKPRWRIPKLTQDDLETVRPARRRTPSPDYEFYYRPRRRSLGDLSDEELLLPIEDYLAMKRTEEERLRLEEELELGFSASPPSRSPPRFELSALRYSTAGAQVHSEEERKRELRYSSYHIPTKADTSASYAELRERYDRAAYRPPKQKQRIMAEREDEELLRPVGATQRLSEYKSELEYMAEEEKSRLRRRREREITEITSEEEEEIEMVQHVHREFSPPSRLLRRRRSLSPTYIELMRPVSELIRPRSRPPEESERRSPTPERTRPRSPSPVSTERSLSRFERMARFDIFSRYESMKSALKTQKTMERKYEVLTQQPFTLDHAPRITLRMRSHRVPCGHNTRFILNVQSKPTADVKWYHNGIELQESSKIHFSNTSGVLTLEILDCHIDDSGTYRAVCTNYKGECSDYATLDVTGGDYTTYSSQRRDEEVPRSILPDLTRTEAYAVSSFKKATAAEASSSVREVKSEVSATRESLLSYEHHASSEEKITASEEKSLEERTVHKAFKSTLPATILTKPRSITVSEGETARFSCDVDGEPAPTITWVRAGQPIVSSRRFQITRTQYKSTFEISLVQIADEGSYTVVVENSEGRQEAHFTLTVQRKRIPEKAITSPPRIKSPEPRVKSPEPVKSPKRVKSPEPISTPSKAKSPPGDKTAPVEKVQLPTASPPKIKEQLKAETLGDKVKLSCAVESSVLSIREVAWYKDGKKLKEDHHFKFHYAADGTYELKIHNLTESDKGEYTCEIMGEGGISKTNFQFTGQVFKNIHSQVQSVSETPKSVEKGDKVLAVSTQKKSSAATEEKAAIEEVIKKSIVTEDVKQLQAEIRASSTQMTVSEGQKVTLKANIPGASEVKWVLNGMELRNSDDYRYGISGSNHTLTIKKASNKDEGILTCEGKTDEGTIKCQYVLTFSKEPSNEPAFITQPKSQNVNEGQDVLFTCEVSGDPSPEVEWLRNNQPVSISLTRSLENLEFFIELILMKQFYPPQIAISSHMRATRSKNTYSLEIRNAAVSDTGKYTVKAKNYHGQCSATASLTVFRKFIFCILC